ncbi:MAG: DUF1573 domain-containing protein [Muribaculaceae bacterium]|nr:DUF1573 domain-containing protein [Muribaculaceae bacterium]
MHKKLLTSAIAMLLGAAAMMAGEPAITLESTSHDFGNISEDGGPVSCEFEFTNTGDEPLVIISANASCGCTRPEYPKKPVQPGKKGIIKITYLPAGRPGEFSKTVRVRTNAPRPKRINLNITGVVIPANK